MIGPVQLFINSQQIGGSVKKILQNISSDKNKYIYSKNNTYSFQFNEEKNKRSSNGSHYLAFGSFTAVFSIKSLNDNFKENNILLKLTYETPQEFLQCMEHYINDKKMYNENIMTVHLWGMIVDAHEQYICNYMIVKEYNIFSPETIQNISIQNKMNLIYDFTLLLNKVSQNNSYIRDLKLANIGYDNTYGKYTIVIIDYDYSTISNKRYIKNAINNGKEFGIIMMSGTYVPYYLTKQYNKLTSLLEIINETNSIMSEINYLPTIDQNKKDLILSKLIELKLSKNTSINDYLTKMLSSTDIHEIRKSLTKFITNYRTITYNLIIDETVSQMHKIASVPLAIFIAELLYESNPLNHSIKNNEFEKFQTYLTTISPSKYEEQFSSLNSARSIVGTEDNEIIKKIIICLLKSNYNDICSYNDIIKLLDTLSFFKNDNKFYTSPLSSGTDEESIKNTYEMVGGQVHELFEL